MRTGLLEVLEEAQKDLSTAWMSIRRAAELLDDVAPRMTEDALAALTVTEEVRDKLRRTLASMDTL